MPTPKFVFKRIALYVLLIVHFTKNSTSGQNQEVAQATVNLWPWLNTALKKNVRANVNICKRKST